MARLKRWARRLFCPPAALTVAVCVPAYALVAWVLLCGTDNAALACAAYAFSAYALTITCTGVCRLVLLIKSIAPPPFVQRVVARPFVQRYLIDESFRAQVALWCGAALNLAYVGIKLYYGITGRSAWFITLAGYYLLLLLMRLPLLHLLLKGGAGPADALRRVRFCGVLLLAMNIVMAGMVMHIVEGGMGFVYSGNLIYIMAMYAFYAVGRAVTQFIRFGRRKNVLLTAVKGLNFVAALVSMLALETAMLTAFGGEGDDFRRLMTGVSGSVVCVIVLFLAVYTIIFTTWRLHRPKRER